MTIILLTIIINTVGFFAMGATIHWLYYRRRADRPDEWKVQPRKHQSWPAIRAKLPLVLTNSVVLSTPVGYGLWAVFEDLTPAYWSLSEHGIGWAVFSTLALFAWYHGVLFYLHRTMHRPIFFKAIHNVHHRFKAPMFMDALYEHPIEAAYGAIVLATPLLVAPVWMPGYFIFAGIVGIHEVMDHSGIDLRIPLLSPARHHDIHHQRCHYYYGQLLGVLDSVHDTGYTPRKPAPSVAIEPTTLES